MNRFRQKFKSVDFRFNTHFYHLGHNMNIPSTSKTFTLSHLSGGTTALLFYCLMNRFIEQIKNNDFGPNMSH